MIGLETSSGVLAVFLYPGLFYGGAAAVAAPILIHLLARRRFKRIRWAAIEFLINAEKRNRRRVQLEQLILLLLRCLALLLIALVISRPYLRPQGWAAMLGAAASGGRTERIFLLDDSYSMSYAAGGRSCFATAKRELIRLLDWTHRRAPGETVTVLRCSALDSPLVSGAYLHEESLEELAARVEALGPSQQTLRIDRAVRTVRTMLDENPDMGGATVFVIGDFQRIDWVERAGGPESTASPLAPLTEWAGQGHGLSVVLVAVGDLQASNCAVAGVGVGRSRLVAGVPARLEVTLTNHSDADMEGSELQVALGPSRARVVAVPPIAARQRATVPVELALPTAGSEAVRVELAPDGLEDDDA